ncbi:MAG: carboxypeptidase-like regulatory domain-containing protein [Muribaculaceae bacterium]|nr:carboxypeptidase-like regulatory domain-containing protein [Muribaculaceae bacterium]
MRSFVSLFIVFAFGSAVWASDPLKGWVVDRNGAPINGAKVYVKHQKSHTTSNDMGEFCLSDVGAVETIHVKIKKKVYDISVGGRRSLYIVVYDLPIVGKGDKNEDIGSRTIVYGEELVKSGQTDLVQALRGRLSGVNISGDGTIKSNRAGSICLSTFSYMGC